MPMKKLYLLLVTCSLLFEVQIIQAQASKGDIRVGGHLGFGTEIESLGIAARGDYAVTNNILIGPDFIYFFGNNNLNWFDLNFNGNYLFEINNPDITPYALAGLNLAIISYDSEYLGIGNSSATEIGLNLGGGADFVVSTFIVFGELRFVLSSADQLVIAGGVKFPLH